MKRILMLVCFFTAVMNANAVVGSNEMPANVQSHLKMDGNTPFVTVHLSCVDITYTNPNTVAVFFGLASLGLADLVIANLEKQWCTPNEPAMLYA